MNQELQSGEMRPEETISEEPAEETNPEASQDGAYWWFFHQFDKSLAATHTDEVEQFSAVQYDAFVSELDEKDKKQLQDFRDKGLQKGDDKQLLETYAIGFSEYVKKLDKE